MAYPLIRLHNIRDIYTLLYNFITERYMQIAEDRYIQEKWHTCHFADVNVFQSFDISNLNSAS